MSEMKLSEAIRLGAMATTQGRGGRMAAGGTRCALAAAADACGMPALTIVGESFVPYASLWTRFPELNWLVSHPTGEHRKRPLFESIYVLNDLEKWTREQIADWVETIERRADAESVRTEQETASTAVSFAQKSVNQP